MAVCSWLQSTWDQITWGSTSCLKCTWKKESSERSNWAWRTPRNSKNYTLRRSEPDQKHLISTLHYELPLTETTEHQLWISKESLAFEHAIVLNVGITIITSHSSHPFLNIQRGGCVASLQHSKWSNLHPLQGRLRVNASPKMAKNGAYWLPHQNISGQRAKRDMQDICVERSYQLGGACAVCEDGGLVCGDHADDQWWLGRA